MAVSVRLGPLASPSETQLDGFKSRALQELRVMDYVPDSAALRKYVHPHFNWSSH